MPKGKKRKKRTEDGVDLSEIVLATTEEQLERFLYRIADLFQIERVAVGDPLTVSALRIIHSVVAAAERKDASTLRAWELPAIRYLEKHQRDAYLDLVLPYRKGVDRHIILRAVRDEIAALLRSGQSNAPRRDPSDFGLAVALLIATYLRPLPWGKLDFMEVCDRIGERYAEYNEIYRQIDPELILIDALELLGVSRQTAHNWMKGLGTR